MTADEVAVTKDEVAVTKVAPGALLAGAIELVTTARNPEHARSRLAVAAVRLSRAVQAGDLDRVLAMGLLIDVAEDAGMVRAVAHEIIARGFARRPVSVGGDRVAPR